MREGPPNEHLVVDNQNAKEARGILDGMDLWTWPLCHTDSQFHDRCQPKAARSAGASILSRGNIRLRPDNPAARDGEARPHDRLPDPQLAADVIRALELSSIPTTVQAAVHDGHVALTGHVAWLYQKNAAEKAVRHVNGVRGVADYITVPPRPLAQDVKRRIMEALHRHASIDARQIGTTIDGSTAVLTGRVASWDERDAAERAAASAPGIVLVDNQILVEPRPLETGVDEMC